MNSKYYILKLERDLSLELIIYFTPNEFWISLKI